MTSRTNYYCPHCKLWHQPGFQCFDYLVHSPFDVKVKGREITAAPQPAAKPGPVIDLMEALRQSMKKIPKKKATRTPRKTRKKA